MKTIILISISLVWVCNATADNATATNATASSETVDIPMLPALPELGHNIIDFIANMSNVGPTVIMNLKSGWAKVNEIRNDTNDQIARLYPLLKDAGEEGSKVQQSLKEFVGKLNVTNLDDPLAIPRLAKSSYHLAEDVLDAIKKSDLKIEGIAKFQETISSVRDQLGLIRCPVAVLECLAASVANLFGLHKGENDEAK